MGDIIDASCKVDNMVGEEGTGTGVANATNAWGEEGDAEDPDIGSEPTRRVFNISALSESDFGVAVVVFTDGY